MYGLWSVRLRANTFNSISVVVSITGVISRSMILTLDMFNWRYFMSSGKTAMVFFLFVCNIRLPVLLQCI